MKKIFITREIGDVGLDLLKDKGYEIIVSKLKRAMTKTELLKVLKKENPDVLVTLLSDKVDKEVLSASKNLKLVANFAVGYNNIDTQVAKTKNIFVTCCRGTSAQAVAQHTIALTLSVLDRIVEGQQLIQKNKWRGWDPDLLMGKDLFGKTVGLIGTGNIGSMVAETLHAGFNCKIIYCDMVENLNLEKNCQAKKVSQEELLKNSDIVSLHVPLMKETTHLINLENLKLMRPTAILINTARGAIVNEKDLVHALKTKIIYGAGLDVFEFEPKVSRELLKFPNVVLTPHIASAKESARNEMALMVVQNIKPIAGSIKLAKINKFIFCCFKFFFFVLDFARTDKL